MPQYARDRNGKRFLLGGMNLVKPLDLLGTNQWAYLQNVRARLEGRAVGRPTMDSSLYTLPATPHTIVRMNDTTPNGPLAGYVRVIGVDSTDGGLFVNSKNVGNGFSGLPMAILPFGPDQSVQPWAYCGDSSQNVRIVVNDSTTQACTGMVKVRSDGLIRKTGIKEPQLAPSVGINTETVTQYLTLPANTPPWTNIGGVNADRNYGGADGQPPYPAIIATPVFNSTVTLTITGTATVNGASHGPGDVGPATTGYPAEFTGASPTIVVWAFTDANGNIVAQSTGISAPKVIGNVTLVSGTSATATLTVPANAVQLQIGIDSKGGTFAANSGSYLIEAVVSTSAITPGTSTVGLVTAYVWGDSPHEGPVASYIWKNPTDVGSGIPRTSNTAQVVATNNSLMMYAGATSGANLPVQWETIDATGTIINLIDLFNPALESDGYQDFNVCVVGSLFFPSGGVYNVQIENKDQVFLAMGGGITASTQPITDVFGQRISVVSALPILFVSTPDGEGAPHVWNFTINVPEQGVYQFELDWDYWYHNSAGWNFGACCNVKIGPTPGAPIAKIRPQPVGVRTEVQYWVKYRASETGAQSNPSPASPIQQTPVLANTVASPFSSDPQVDKADYYRQDQGLSNPTYVGTGPNDGLGGTVNGVVYNTAIEDTLSDIAAATSQIMQSDDFEPFPSIDTPKAGMVTIVDGVVTWKSGDKFNPRWLPGTLILIGSPTQTAYSLVARPLSATQIVIPTIPDTIGDAAGDGVPYNIAQPILAQQPLPSMWGPDAYGFMHACGDPNQPGAYVWTKAYNPDSAPQTNRLLLTSPSEVLMGGVLINGISMVFSTLRAWLMYPNFADAQATTEGTLGNPWNPILAVVTRGLYIRNCLCAIGGKAVAFRAADGISVTSGGGEQSITDETLYPLFPHENYSPLPVTIGATTIYPPDDTKPQKLAYQTGYVYYDYIGTDGNPHTLVFDEQAKGWSVDIGSPAFTVHGQDYAPNLSDTVVGCLDGSIRVLQSGGSEAATSVVATGAENAGDARALKRVADVYVRAVIADSSPVAVALYTAQYQTLLTGFAPTSLTGTGVLEGYIVDCGAHEPQDVSDLEMVLSWPTNSGNELDLWQPSLLDLPISILSRVTEGLTFGLLGYQHAYLCNLMYVSSTQITLTLHTDEGDVAVVFPASGSLLVPSKVMVKFPRNKFKVSSYQLNSAQPFYLFGCELWLGQWGRGGEYVKVNPFNVNADAEVLSG